MRGLRMLIAVGSVGTAVAGSAIAVGSTGALADGSPPLLGHVYTCVHIGDYGCYVDYDHGYEKAGVVIYSDNPNTNPSAPVVLGVGAECDHNGNGTTSSHLFIENGSSSTNVAIPILPVGCK